MVLYNLFMVQMFPKKSINIFKKFNFILLRPNLKKRYSLLFMKVIYAHFCPENDPPVEADIENVSGKLESFSLSDAIETSLNMQGMTAPASEPRRGEWRLSYS